MGLEQRGAGLLRGASGTGPAAGRAARAGEAGAGTSHPSRRGPKLGRRLDSRRRRRVGAGKGQEFNEGCGGFQVSTPVLTQILDHEIGEVITGIVLHWMPARES